MEHVTFNQIIMNLRNLSQKKQEDLQKKSKGKQRENLYKCAKCKDTGWILVKKEDGREVAVSCECREKERLKLQWKAAGINIENCNLTFSNYEEWNNSSSIAKSIAVTYYNFFARDYKSRTNSILLCGQVGAGKTHLAIAIGLNLIKANYKVMYMPYRDTITKLKQNMCAADVYGELIDKFKKSQVLLIDDLYKGKINETDVNIMFEIINYRYVNHLPIIVSSEFNINSILKFDESIGSRIYEMCKNYIVEIEKDMKNNYRLRA